jgi:YfiH family protein
MRDQGHINYLLPIIHHYIRDPFQMCTEKLFKPRSLHKYPSRLGIISEGHTPYLQSLSLSGMKGLTHRIFTRLGGVSRPPYDSLNSSYQNGDRPEDVKENLRIIRDSLEADQLIFMNQVHGKNIIPLAKNDYPTLPASAPEADALITDIPSMAIMVKQADCQGVIMYDPAKRIVSVTHCGWRGNLCNILASVVISMKTRFGCDPRDIMAFIGPSLGPCCAEFRSHEKMFPREFERHMVREDYFDLWGISRSQLLEAGLRNDKIEIAGICTRCNSELLYSYRADNITGRFATVAMLR